MADRVYELKVPCTYVATIRTAAKSESQAIEQVFDLFRLGNHNQHMHEESSK